ELGDLPLALELAGSYLARYREEPAGAPATYLAELRAADLLAHVSLTVEDPETPERTRSLTGHERDVARTFEVSLRKLRPEAAVDALARELFARAAWLAPGVPIPRRLLKLCAGITVDDASAGRRFADALNRLLDLALLEPASGEGMVVLHRLLAAFARSRMEQASFSRNAVEAVVEEEAWRSLSQNDPRPIRDWAPHLMAVARAAGRDKTGAAVRLLNRAGCYSLLEADFDVSQAMLQEAVARAEALFGPDHPEVASTLGNLGTVQRQRGELEKAEASQTRALEIKEKAYGPDHPEVAITLTNLGAVQYQRGELEKAEANQTRALAIKEKVYGPDRPEVALTLGNLGNVQRERGELEKAEASLTRVLAIMEKVYGPDHPEVARTLDNLGIVQNERGELEKAEDSQTRALAIMEKVYGPDHPEVASTLTNLGIVQRERGELEKAKASLTRALAIKEKTHGPGHPTIALTLTNLGIMQHGRGELGMAEASQTRALAIQEKAYGPDHPEVAITLTNLGSVQRDQNRFEEARGSYKRAATIFAAKLGEQHPHTLKARNLIAEISGEGTDIEGG
ncbi:MAG: tetratricopeptide repeat protein, partial [Trebonia sp.]